MVKQGEMTGKDKFDKFRVNEEIDAPEVRLVGEEGEPQIIAMSKALEMAREKNLDLGEITGNQDPPVVRIIPAMIGPSAMPMFPPTTKNEVSLPRELPVAKILTWQRAPG